MNCAICLAYLRDKNHCVGCRGSDTDKNISCIRCKIKNCNERKGKYCFSCKLYPCEKIKHIDKRYRTKYEMSMIENLNNIKKIGITKFVKNETKRWTCPSCKGVICVHKGYCYNCGKIKE
ncbi:Uncharacterised protein [Candidatus Tiddalikarchaeum anstoanum]|nr:Uncharacterised protein [Candidatus Tiddalikarchaeum anstoanum]